MNVTHQPRVLELDTQTDLLERLRLLTNYGSNFVTVGGAYGSGKTWLAQRYLEAWAQDKNQSLLMCHPSQDDESRRSTVLTQLPFLFLTLSCNISLPSSNIPSLFPLFLFSSFIFPSLS